MARPWVIKDADVKLYIEAARHVVDRSNGWPWTSQGRADWLINGELDEDAYPDGDQLKAVLEAHLTDKILRAIKARVRLVRHRRDNVLVTMQVHPEAGRALSNFAREKELTLSQAILALTAAQASNNNISGS